MRSHLSPAVVDIPDNWKPKAGAQGGSQDSSTAKRRAKRGLDAGRASTMLSPLGNIVAPILQTHTETQANLVGMGRLSLYWLGYRRLLNGRGMRDIAAECP